MCSLTMMFLFHKIFIAAYRRACGLAAEDVDGDISDLSDGEGIGNLSNQAWKRRETRRSMKALVWVEKQSSRFLTVMFVTIAKKAMRLHFWFFRWAQSTP